jgi:hypothetical protein
MVISDEEATACGERLELLAVVRGLEALDGPARVTLVTKSRYVSRGLRFGMAEWRVNDWQWERFGRVVPVKDHDLWQRVDRALLFHQVECQAWQFETAATTDEPLSCRESLTEAVQVEVVRPRCSETVPNPCEAIPLVGPAPTPSESRLAPTKRRLATSPRTRKRRLAAACERSERGTLTAALVSKAVSLRETLRDFVSPAQQLASGAA